MLIAKIETWLLRANARGVFAAAVAALIAVSAWRLWKETVARAPARRIRTDQAVQSEARKIPDLLSLLDRPRPARGVETEANPFFRPVPRVEKPDDDGRARTAQPKSDVARRSAKPAAVQLVYRGLFTRPDGRQLALIETKASGASAFHEVGAKLLGFTIERASFDRLELRGPDNAAVRMELGQARQFTEEANAQQ